MNAEEALKQARATIEQDELPASEAVSLLDEYISNINTRVKDDHNEQRTSSDWPAF